MKLDLAQTTMLQRHWSNSVMGVLILLSLVVISLMRLPEFWAKNQYYINAISNHGVSTVSPYGCLLILNCHGHLELLQDDDRQILAISTDGSQEAIVEQSFERIPLRILASGGFLYREGFETEAVNVWKQYPELAYYMNSLSQDLEDENEKQRLLYISLQVMPTVDGYLQLGNSLYQVGRNERAQWAFQQALLLERTAPQPNRARQSHILGRLGNTYWRQRNVERAGQIYLEALRLNPDNIIALRGWSRVQDQIAR